LLTALPSNPNNFHYNELAYLIKNYHIHYLYSVATYLNNKTPLTAQPEDEFGGFAVEDVSLPGAVVEVKDIADITNGMAWTGEQATEKNFKDHADKYSVLHLSMHGTLDDDHPLYSKLIFTQTQDSIQDDSLTVAEIYTLRLKAQMAVLSACETGDGPVSRGEGIMSLSRAFAYAGCPSVITSLWKVDAKHALTLMQDFYKHLLKGLPKDQALQQAKLNFLQSTDDPLQAHPHFWLSFIVTGDVAPVNFGGNYQVLIGSSFVIIFLLIIGVFVWRKYAGTNPTVVA
jgi:CHAT domain-containing protein